LPNKQDAIAKLRITKLNSAYCRNRKSGETQHEICPSIEILETIEILLIGETRAKIFFSLIVFDGTGCCPSEDSLQ
jgi:hypothetical protein